jgi:hypothetical protein
MKTKQEVIDLVTERMKRRLDIEQKLRWALDKVAVKHYMHLLSVLDLEIKLLKEVLNYEEIDAG